MSEKPQKTPKELGPQRNLLYLPMLLLVFALVIQNVWYARQHIEDLPYSQFVAFVKQGRSQVPPSPRQGSQANSRNL